MTTRLTTAGVILVAAIIFGFIFWNQFTSNQRNLAGGNDMPAAQTQKAPTHDNLTAIETDLNGIDLNSVDSDSTQISTELSGF